MRTLDPCGWAGRPDRVPWARRRRCSAQGSGAGADRSHVIRVLVVDDSALIRRLVITVLSAEADVEVVGYARNGLEAIDKVRELEPDAVTLDIEMPELDGLGALRGIRESHPRLPVVMFSTLTEKGASKTLEALSLGASDYVTKPSNTGSVAESMQSVRDQLVPKIRALTAVRRMAAHAGPLVRRSSVVAAPVREHAGHPEVLLIGCSTGGPDALSSVLEQLPGDLGVPVLVVQHMPPVFTTMFSKRLDKVSPLRVREAEDGDVLEPGLVLVAPGDWHLQVKSSVAGTVRVALDQGPQESFCRPAVDPLFRSAASVWGGRALAVVLTGMGQDGMLGAKTLHDAGARVLVQDEETSVVWGMPGAVAQAGLADEVLPLDQVAGRIAALLRR